MKRLIELNIVILINFNSVEKLLASTHVFGYALFGLPLLLLILTFSRIRGAIS